MPLVEERLASLEARMDAIERMHADINRQFSELRGEIAALRESFDRRFMWLVGMQVASLVAVIAALLRIS